MNKDLKEFERKMIRALVEATKTSLPKIGEDIKDAIVKRTKAGIGTDQNKAGTKPLKPLKPATIRKRTRLRAKGKLASDTTPAKSNFTASGHTLSNIDDNVSVSKKTVTLAIDKGKDRKKVKDNAKLGRKWFKVTAKEFEKAVDIVTNQFLLAKRKLGL